MEEPLTAADRNLGGVTQGLARCVEAESVEKCGLASKGSAPRQKVRPRALTDQPENGKVPRKARRPSLKNRVMLDLDQACALAFDLVLQYHSDAGNYLLPEYIQILRAWRSRGHR